MNLPPIVKHFLKRFSPLLRLYPEEIHWVGTRIPIPRFDAPQILALLELARPVFSQNPVAVLDLPLDAWVIGDIHGNFHDLLRILARIGSHPKHPVVFLGDYVDRGSYSIEVILLLLTLKCAYPQQFFFLRGNHEFARVNEQYGFKEECDSRYPASGIWESVNALFAWLPLVILLGETVVCIHGGIGPNCTSVDDLRRITVPIPDYSPEGVVAELVWSDPTDQKIEFIASSRGCGYLFGLTALRDFLRRSGCKTILRAHECMQYGLNTIGKDLGLTIFSSSNYSHRGNQGGFVEVTAEGTIEPVLFAPLENIMERIDAEYEDVTPVDDKGISFSGLPSLSGPTGLRKTSFPGSKLSRAVSVNRVSGVNMKPEIAGGRRAALKHIASVKSLELFDVPVMEMIGVDGPE
jgi:protein phosphatase